MSVQVRCLMSALWVKPKSYELPPALRPISLSRRPGSSGSVDHLFIISKPTSECLHGEDDVDGRS
ncbi:hypothetical protein SAY86_029749 [Trapa natans]|uniref:Uncharacterized protein n=1 Tax=Trapa natans TaxID=22666 RepID=A0AAN7MNS7_TRANT|nr:hypothetical protein SAY86_029749 [Trapa natans]